MNDDHILTLEKAKRFTAMPELYLIFWKDWEVITEVEYEALKYLVDHKSRIILPNVKSLGEKEKELLRNYTANNILIGVYLNP